MKIIVCIETIESNDIINHLHFHLENLVEISGFYR